MQYNILYNDDVLNVLKNTPDSSLDMVFGDPDYNVGINYNDGYDISNDDELSL